MAKHAVKLEKEKVIRLYERYGTITRTALSLNCSPSRLKKYLVENDIPIKEYKPKAFNYNLTERR